MPIVRSATTFGVAFLAGFAVLGLMFLLLPGSAPVAPVVVLVWMGALSALLQPAAAVSLFLGVGGFSLALLLCGDGRSTSSPFQLPWTAIICVGSWAVGAGLAERCRKRWPSVVGVVLSLMISIWHSHRLAGFRPEETRVKEALGLVVGATLGLGLVFLSAIAKRSPLSKLHPGRR